VFDIAMRIQYLTMDIITHLCFSKPFGFVDADDDVYDFLSSTKTMLPIVHHFTVILEFNTILHMVRNLPWLKKLVVPSAANKSGIGKTMAVNLLFLPFGSRS